MNAMLHIPFSLFYPTPGHSCKCLLLNQFPKVSCHCFEFNDENEIPVFGFGTIFEVDEPYGKWPHEVIVGAIWPLPYGHGTIISIINAAKVAIISMQQRPFFASISREIDSRTPQIVGPSIHRSFQDVTQGFWGEKGIIWRIPSRSPEKSRDATDEKDQRRDFP